MAALAGMIRTKRAGGENPMEDEVLERNKNLNRGFRKLAPEKQETKRFHGVNLEGSG